MWNLCLNIITMYLPSKQPPWWRRLEDFFRLHLQKTSSRRLQDVLIKTNMFALVIRLQKTSLNGLQEILVKQIYSSWSYFFKTSSRHVQDVLPRRFQDVLKTSLRLLQYVLKTFSRRPQDTFKTSYQDVFKTSSRCLKKISSRLFQDVSSS